MSVFEPSLARRGLDELLKLHPHLDLLSVDWQLPPPPETGAVRVHAGPWLLVELGQPSQGDRPAWAVWHFAIWKYTGAVHRLNGGEVEDDPLVAIATAKEDVMDTSDNALAACAEAQHVFETSIELRWQAVAAALAAGVSHGAIAEAMSVPVAYVFEFEGRSKR